MLVKNTSQKVIGFGTLCLLPGETKELPAGFGENHPVVLFYLKKKYIVKADSTTSSNDETDTGGDTLTDEQKAAAADAAKKAGIASKIKKVAKMNLDPLRKEATALGITFTEDDTVDVLRQKITEKLRIEMG